MRLLTLDPVGMPMMVVLICTDDCNCSELTCICYQPEELDVDRYGWLYFSGGIVALLAICFLLIFCYVSCKHYTRNLILRITTHQTQQENCQPLVIRNSHCHHHPHDVLPALPCAPKFNLGDLVMITSLAGNQAYNGRQAEVLEYLTNFKRYAQVPPSPN